MVPEWLLNSISRNSPASFSCICIKRLLILCISIVGIAMLINDLTDAPVCRRSKPLTVVVSRDQPAKLRCQVRRKNIYTRIYLKNNK